MTNELTFTDDELAGLHDENAEPIEPTVDNLDDNPDEPKLDDDGNPINTDDEGGEGDDNQQDKNDDNPDDSIINTVIDEFGIELDENEEIEESSEGLKTVINKVAEKASVEAVAKVFTQYPLAADLVKHLKEGMTIESFLMEKNAIDYTKIELPQVSDEAEEEVNEKAIEKHKELIKDNLLAKGASPKEIERYIKASVEEGTTYDDAKDSLKELTDRQKAQIESKKAQEKAAYDASVKEAQDTLVEITTKVDSGVIGDFKLPKADLQGFKDFVSKFDENGNSQRDIKSSKLTLEQSLLLDYILYKDFKVTGLEKKSATDVKKQAADKNKERLKFKSASSVDTNSQGDEDDILSKAFNALGK
jgi:hypothetical protein